MNIPTLTSPKLFDKVQNELNAALEANISWLTKAYPRADVITEQGTDGSEFTYPAVRILGGSGNDYLKMMPDQNLGNFCFIKPVGRQNILNEYGKGNYRVSQEIEVVFWFDYREVFASDPETYTDENIKDELIEFFNNYSFVTFQAKPTGFINDHNDIYSGYRLDAVYDQYYMRPYGVFSILLEMRYFTENCFGAVPTVTLPTSTIQADWDEDNINSPSFILNKPTIGNPVVLYSTTEFNTGLTDDDGNIIYGKTFNVVNTDLEATPGGTGYQTDIPKAYINEVIDYRIRLKTVTGDTVYALNHQDGGTSSSVYVGTSTFFDNWLVYPLTNSALVTYKITIYYTKN